MCVCVRYVFGVGLCCVHACVYVVYMCCAYGVYMVCNVVSGYVSNAHLWTPYGPDMDPLWTGPPMDLVLILQRRP